VEINQRVRFLHYIRQQELEASLYGLDLPADARVLDFGSGDGFAARLLRNKGYQVSAVDIAPRFPQHYPVTAIGNTLLPFRAGSFDLIYASNVLEHVENLAETLDEFSRILKPGGLGVFSMPTPVWRLCAWLDLPFSWFQRRVLREKVAYYQVEHQTEMKLQRSNASKPKKLVQYLLRPHGSAPSAMHELITFSEFYWRRVFEQNGFSVEAVMTMPLFYTASLIFPGRFIAVRKRLVSRFTASCLTYRVSSE
jgi:SAM-dependent methyltransferase